MWPGCRCGTGRRSSFGRHYGVSVLTCEPADPAAKGGVEASVKVAKADLVPTDTNLRARLRLVRRAGGGV